MIAVPPENQLVNCREPHAEFLDTATGTVWQSHLPITAEEWAELTLPEPLVKLGLGRGAMDEHWFRCSPGAEAPGAVSERTVAGRRFIHCANPPAGGGDRPVQGGPVRLFVDKHHSLCFHAGRTAQILRLPDGREYVQVIEASPEGGGLLQQGRGSMDPRFLTDGCCEGFCSMREPSYTCRRPLRPGSSRTVRASRGPSRNSRRLKLDERTLAMDPCRSGVPRVPGLVLQLARPRRA